MAQERFTASLDADLKKRLEEVGQKNFRKLNGELNIAVEFYLKHAVSEISFVAEKDTTSKEVIMDKPANPSITPYQEVSERQGDPAEVSATPTTVASSVRGRRI